MADQKPPIYFDTEKKALHIDVERVPMNMCNMAELGDGWSPKRVTVCKEENGEIVIKPIGDE